jgi:uncharacterized protein YukE
MANITKKEYQNRQQEIQSKIDSLEKVLQSLPLETEGIPQNIVSLIGETWNTTHDTIEELQQELKFLDDEWSRRNWSYSDHMQHDLITSNID